MEAILKRIGCIQDLHKKYSEAVEFQLSSLSEEISKITPTQQGSQDETDQNMQCNVSRRGAPRRSVIVNNNSRAIPNSTREAFGNSRVTSNIFKRPSNENRGPRTRRMNQLMNNSSGTINRPIRNSCTTSKKMRDFSVEPIGDKTVDKIPGIGPKAAAKLSTLNYKYARRLLGKFLETDKEEFQEFLEIEAEVLPHNAEKTWRSIEDYRINQM